MFFVICGKPSMSSLSRPLLLTLLIASVAFGHAPAWLHLATTHGIDQDTAVSRTACSCSHHHLAKTAGDSGNPPEDARGSEHDGCVLCQSLFGTVGFVAAGNADLFFQRLVTKLVSLDHGENTSPLRSWAHPRGPPILTS